MTAAEQIQSLARANGIELASAVVPNPLIEGGYFVPITISREGANQKPSGRELAALREAAGEAGYVIEFLLTNENSRQIEEGLRASFLSSFPQIVRNSFLSVEDGTAVVWIEKKRDLSKDELDRLENHARTYASLFALRGARVHLTSDSNLPTNTEILSVIRNQAPATCESVRSILVERHFAVPSLDWVNRRFDALRRTGLLIRMSDGAYALTLEALERLGTVKNRRSPDVARFLALARRGE